MGAGRLSGTLAAGRRKSFPGVRGIVERFTAGITGFPASMPGVVPPAMPDLEDEAMRMGVRVSRQPLPAGICGVYDWPHNRIVLHDGLTPVQSRCTLCHELEHVRHGDRSCTGKGEARARRRTALRLVNPVDYAAAEQVYDGCAWRIACELGVTMQVVQDYRRILHDSGVCVQ